MFSLGSGGGGDQLLWPFWFGEAFLRETFHFLFGGFLLGPIAGFATCTLAAFLLNILGLLHRLGEVPGTHDFLELRLRTVARCVS